jgi:hypothetical protein
MNKSDYSYRVADLANLIKHPLDDTQEIAKRLRNYCTRHLIKTRYTDQHDSRRPFLLAVPDALIGAVLLRLYDAGLSNAEASQATAARLGAWHLDDIPAEGQHDPQQAMRGWSRDPAAMIWEQWQADPATARWTLTIRWLRSNQNGQPYVKALLWNEAEGILGKGMPEGDWEITCEMVIVLDDILGRISSRLAARKVH